MDSLTVASKDDRHRLLMCLVDEFIAAHGDDTTKLPELSFSLCDRMGPSKSAGLNREYMAVETIDGVSRPVRVETECLTDAVYSLEVEGYVDLDRKTLCYNVT